MKRLNHRGFTLIELLATIVIVALVLGIGIYGVSNLVDNSKNKSKVISMSSIKESASVYSDEDSDRWIESYGDDYSYFCTTIEELINKGIIKKNAILPDGIDKSEYVSIKKNKTTLVKSEAVVLDSDGASRDESAYKVCTGNDIPTEGVSSPSIGGNTSYTDSIIVNFTDGDDAGIKDKWCQYNTNATIKDGVNVIKLNNDDSKCKIDNLKDDTNYYVRICKTTTGGSRACSDTVGYSTKEFIKPSISYSGLTSKIEFSDSGIESGKALHYFKSNIGGTSNAYVYECDNEFNCSSATKNISADKWYKTSNSTITIDYSNSDGVENGTISARISDGSNYSDVSSNFTLYKVVFKVGSADSIGGSSSDITKRCLTTSGSCSITSPSISKYCYSGMGWSTSSNANSSSWAPNSSKSISSSGTYYPTLGSIITYAINYNANGGYNAPSVQYKTCGSSITLSSNTPSRTNYNFNGWSTSSNGYVSYYPGSTYSNNSSVTLYAQWSYRWYCSYTGLRYDTYNEASEACTVTSKYTASKVSSSYTTYSCPSGYSCGGSCTSSSTCSKTTNGTVTTKYYCSHSGFYQTSSTCSYVGGYYDASYGLNCVESNCSYSCSSGTLDGSTCYADYWSYCPSGWTNVKTNYCSYTCGVLTQGVSKSKECTVYGSCSSNSSLSCYANGTLCQCSGNENSGCSKKTYYYKCSKAATKNCSKTYSGGSYYSTTTSGSCASGYTASKGSSCSNPPRDGYCDTRQYWAGQSCTSSMATGATVRNDMICSKTGTTSYYCSITKEYTSSKPSCTSTDTTDVNSSTTTTYSCPSGYSEDSSGGCYKYVTNTYTVS